MAEDVKRSFVSLVAEIAGEECKNLYERRLAGLEEELAALYKTLEGCGTTRANTRGLPISSCSSYSLSTSGENSSRSNR